MRETLLNALSESLTEYAANYETLVVIATVNGGLRYNQGLTCMTGFWQRDVRDWGYTHTIQSFHCIIHRGEFVERPSIRMGLWRKSQQLSIALEVGPLSSVNSNSSWIKRDTVDAAYTSIAYYTIQIFGG